MKVTNPELPHARATTDLYLASLVTGGSYCDALSTLG